MLDEKKEKEILTMIESIEGTIRLLTQEVEVLKKSLSLNTKKTTKKVFITPEMKAKMLTDRFYKTK